MNLESVYFISQVIAATAVVGSLIFVGIQIRQNTRMHRAHGNASRMSVLRENLAAMTDKDHAELFFAGASLERELTEIERARFVLSVVQYVVAFLEVHEMHATGVVGPSQWAQTQSAASYYMSLPGFRAAYRIYRLNSYPHPGFEWLDGLLQNTALLRASDAAAAWNSFTAMELAAVEAANAKRDASSPPFNNEEISKPSALAADRVIANEILEVRAVIGSGEIRAGATGFKEGQG